MNRHQALHKTLSICISLVSNIYSCRICHIISYISYSGLKKKLGLKISKSNQDGLQVRTHKPYIFCSCLIMLAESFVELS